MSTIIVAAILVGSVIAICYFLISIHNKHKRKAMNTLLKHYSQMGTEYGLNFSGQEILKNCIIGIDGINRKVLVVRKENELYVSQIIYLNKVKSCSVKKIYGTIKANDLKKHQLEQYLEKIILHFEISDQPPVEVIFYQHVDNHILEALEMELKAKNWETVLSKMHTPSRKTA